MPYLTGHFSVRYCTARVYGPAAARNLLIVIVFSAPSVPLGVHAGDPGKEIATGCIDFWQQGFSDPF